MYLSRIQLKPGLDLKTLADAVPKDAYAEHKIIWTLFRREEQRNFLFHREEAGHWPLFYTLSQNEPFDPKGIWSIESKGFMPKLQLGQRLAFMLRANPVITRCLDGKKRMRDDVVMRAKRTYQKSERPSQAELVQQAGPIWLTERAEKHGFQLESLYVDHYRQHCFSKPGKKQLIRFSTLDYQGRLQLTDIDAFTKMLFAGLGHSKSFGCGLMLIRRV